MEDIHVDVLMAHADDAAKLLAAIHDGHVELVASRPPLTPLVEVIEDDSAS